MSLRGWILTVAFATGLLSALGAGKAQGQENPHGPLKVSCSECHTADSWKVDLSHVRFDHAKTDFPLNGQHAAVSCRQCHSALKFSGASKNCASCHSDIHRGELGLACERCHSPQSWLIPDMAQRHSETRFALLGAHLTVACQSCHPNEQKHQYIGAPVECYGCHQADFQTTLAPAHVPAGFSTDCVQCHPASSISWGSGFDHSRTGFALTGAHAALACNACHKNNQFTPLPHDCYSCHQSDYAGAANPPHAAGGFPTTCDVCHSTVAWSPASFQHDNTGFPLTGAHRTVACGTCHKNNQYTGLPTDCYGCHQSDYAGATNPPHAGSSFPTTCTTCHTTTAWSPSTFQHDSYFPISAGSTHSPGRWTSCADCHTDPTNYMVFSCFKCHSQPNMDSQHAGVPNYSYNSAACYRCHPTGRSGG